jgi:hypothetical protein
MRKNGFFLWFSMWQCTFWKVVLTDSEQLQAMRKWAFPADFADERRSILCAGSDKLAGNKTCHIRGNRMGDAQRVLGHCG